MGQAIHKGDPTLESAVVESGGGFGACFACFARAASGGDEERLISPVGVSFQRPLSCDLTEITTGRSWPIPAGGLALVRMPMR